MFSQKAILKQSKFTPGFKNHAFYGGLNPSKKQAFDFMWLIINKMAQLLFKGQLVLRVSSIGGSTVIIQLATHA